MANSRRGALFFSLLAAACGGSGDSPTNSVNVDAPTHPDAAVGSDAATGADAGSVGRDVFVDPAAGDDTHAGSQAAPYQTLGKAITAVGAGHTIFLASGSYDATNQKAAAFTVPDGVTVGAVEGGTPVLAALTLTFSGASGGMSGVTLDSDAAAIVSNTTAAAPTLTFDHVTFLNPGVHPTRLDVRGKSKVLLLAPSISGRLFSGRVNLFDGSEVVVMGGVVDGQMNTGGSGFGAAIFAVTGSSKLTLDGVTMKDINLSGIGVNALSAAAPATVTLKGGTLFDNVGAVGNCAASSSVVLTANVTLDVGDTTFRSSMAGGVCVRNGNGNILVNLKAGTVFDNVGAGLVAETGTGSTATVTIRGATFMDNIGSGISWAGFGSFDIQDATFTGNGTGMQFSSNNVNVKVRGATITGNASFGVQLFHLSGGVAGAVFDFDFGTAASPGGNTLSGNTSSGLSMAVLAADVVNAVGNTWNAGVQNADGSGHYPAGTQVTTTADTGTNYHLVNPSTLNL